MAEDKGKTVDLEGNEVESQYREKIEPRKFNFVRSHGQTSEFFEDLVDLVSSITEYEKIDNFTLSVIAQSFYLFQTVAKKVNTTNPKKGKIGAIQIFEKGTRQISPEYTIFKEERAFLLKEISKLRLLSIGGKSALDEPMQSRLKAIRDQRYG